MRNIQEKEALEFLSPYFGKEVSRVWLGHGSAIFLEIGELSGKKGQLTIMIEWSWRVENEKDIAFGSWSEEDYFSSQLQELKGLTLLSISFQGRLQEVIAELSNKKWVCSFSTVEGDPEWAIISKGKTLLSKNGRLAFE